MLDLEGTRFFARLSFVSERVEPGGSAGGGDVAHLRGDVVGRVYNGSPARHREIGDPSGTPRPLKGL